MTEATAETAASVAAVFSKDLFQKNPMSFGFIFSILIITILCYVVAVAATYNNMMLQQ